MRPHEMLVSIEEAAAEIGQEGFFAHRTVLSRSNCSAMVGDLDLARRLSDDSVALAERMGAAFLVVISCESRGLLELQAGNALAAERAYRKEYGLLERLGDEGHRSTAAALLARALCRLDRLDEADRFARIAIEVGAQDDLVSQAGGRCAQALVRSARSEHTEAMRSARDAVEMIADAQMPNFQGEAWMALAEALRAAGETGAAPDAARNALSFFERKGNQLAITSTQAFLTTLDA
jgi:tetratricopeptide (TPR) repeat protein